MRRAQIRLSDEAGLHARPADLFVRAASGFRSRVRLRHGEAVADGKQIVSVLLLDARRGSEILLETDGPDEAVCVAALGALLSRPPIGARLQRRTATGRAWVLGSARTTAAPDLEEAVVRAAHDIRAQRAALLRDAGGELAAVLGAHESFLERIGSAARGHARTEPATAAVRRACAALCAELEHAESPGVRSKAADVREVAARVLDHLEGRVRHLPEVPGPWILVVPQLDAATVLEARAHGVAGFLTAGLDPAAHAWILARGLGLPVSVVAPEGLAQTGAGDQLIVTDETAAPVATLAAHPTGRRRIPVRANVSSVEEGVDAFALGADGVGVVRTELLFAAAREAPSREEQEWTYAQLLLPHGSHAVTFRFFDAGGDKDVQFLPGGAEPRGIARLRRFPAVLADQAAAVLALAGQARVRLLAPYVESPADLEGLPRAVPLGAMIESPAAVEAVDAIAEVSDFLSIGTNDLAAAVLRRPRERTTLEDQLHPDVLACVERVVAAGHARGLEVSVCGEVARLPAAIERFLVWGVDALSVSPGRFVEVARHLVEDG